MSPPANLAFQSKGSSHVERRLSTVVPEGQKPVVRAYSSLTVSFIIHFVNVLR
jgi:hypothetical protein